MTGSTEVYDKMCCDCRRAAPVGRNFTFHYWELQKENRFYYNKERDTRAAFYFMHGDADAFGLAHTFEGCNAVKTAANINTVLADDPKREPAWKGNPNGLVQSLLANNVSHDVIIVNAGLWRPKWRSNMTDVAEYIENAAYSSPAHRQKLTRRPWDINTLRIAVQLITRGSAPMMLAYLCIGLAFIPEFEERSIQVALVCATDPDEIPDTNFPELAAWDMLPKGDVDAHRATVKLVATALAGPKLLTRRPWDNNTQQFAVQTMGRPDTTMLLTTTVAFGLDDTGSRNVSAANTPHAAAPGDGRTDESTLPDREPMRHALVHHNPPVRAPPEAKKAAASASPSLAVYQRHSLHSLCTPLLHPRSTAFFAEPPSNVPRTVGADDSRRDTPRHSDWHWVPPIGPTAATSAATHSTTPRRPRSLPRHPTPTSILLPPRNILRSLTRKQRRLQRVYDGILAHRRAQQEANDRSEEHASGRRTH
ncbi:hypothetical protein DIPPA_17301 [Diplonema papillatum]|nr:hypothetical protein DIPPA_17301 [Diplonema papillatum]